eukprot:1152488-Amphidinium_carterae.1
MKTRNHLAGRSFQPQCPQTGDVFIVQSLPVLALGPLAEDFTKGLCRCQGGVLTKGLQGIVLKSKFAMYQDFMVQRRVGDGDSFLSKGPLSKGGFIIRMNCVEKYILGVLGTRAKRPQRQRVPSSPQEHFKKCLPYPNSTSSRAYLAKEHYQ